MASSNTKTYTNEHGYSIQKQLTSVFHYIHLKQKKNEIIFTIVTVIKGSKCGSVNYLLRAKIVFPTYYIEKSHDRTKCNKDELDEIFINIKALKDESKMGLY